MTTSSTSKRKTNKFGAAAAAAEADAAAEAQYFLEARALSAVRPAGNGAERSSPPSVGDTSTSRLDTDRVFSTYDKIKIIAQF